MQERVVVGDCDSSVRFYCQPHQELVSYNFKACHLTGLKALVIAICLLTVIIVIVSNLSRPNNFRKSTPLVKGAVNHPRCVVSGVPRGSELEPLSTFSYVWSSHMLGKFSQKIEGFILRETKHRVVQQALSTITAVQSGIGTLHSTTT